MSEDLKKVYSGSRAEGLFIREILEESNISAMFRDAFQESIQAGWADGLPEDRIRIYVETKNVEAATKVIEDYFASRDKE